MSILYTHRMDFNNPGDIWSSPHHYIGKPGLLMDLFNISSFSNIDTLIVGGGAILSNQRMITNLGKLLSDNDFKYKIFWGGGITTSDETDKILKTFNFIGCRNYGTNFQFLPCPSVMHPFFKNKSKSKKDFLVVDHWKRIPIIFNKPHTRFINKFNSIDYTLSEISSHEYIITSSYHVAYWGIILGKKVIVVSNDNLGKFQFKQKIPIDTLWQNYLIDNAISYPEAYEECLDLNLAFLHESTKSGIL